MIKLYAIISILWLLSGILAFRMISRKLSIENDAFIKLDSGLDICFIICTLGGFIMFIMAIIPYTVFYITHSAKIKVIKRKFYRFILGKDIIE